MPRKTKVRKHKRKGYRREDGTWVSPSTVDEHTRNVPEYERKEVKKKLDKFLEERALENEIVSHFREFNSGDWFIYGGATPFKDGSEPIINDEIPINIDGFNQQGQVVMGKEGISVDIWEDQKGAGGRPPNNKVYTYWIRSEDGHNNPDEAITEFVDTFDFPITKDQLEDFPHSIDKL
jgi:hypothetical protein